LLLRPAETFQAHFAGLQFLQIRILQNAALANDLVGSGRDARRFCGCGHR